MRSVSGFASSSETGSFGQAAEGRNVLDARFGGTDAAAPHGMLGPVMSDGTPNEPGDGDRPTFAPHPVTGTGAPPPHRYDDEISLRELYLILRRGLPLILIVTTIGALASFALVVLLPATYEAEATVVSSPTTVQVQDEGALAFALMQRCGVDIDRD